MGENGFLSTYARAGHVLFRFFVGLAVPELKAFIHLVRILTILQISCISEVYNERGECAFWNTELTSIILQVY